MFGMAELIEPVTAAQLRLLARERWLTATEVQHYIMLTAAGDVAVRATTAPRPPCELDRSAIEH